MHIECPCTLVYPVLVLIFCLLSWITLLACLFCIGVYCLDYLHGVWPIVCYMDYDFWLTLNERLNLDIFCVSVQYVTYRLNADNRKWTNIRQFQRYQEQRIVKCEYCKILKEKSKIIKMQLGRTVRMTHIALCQVWEVRTLTTEDGVLSQEDALLIRVEW